ncbi:unnamed protein product [marine sediment metagenome]|uniref:Uncharacterized protein n=1 Tax=marine sediment metagenome TaxID=412755 RepID=X1FXT5_9ZZZZ
MSLYSSDRGWMKSFIISNFLINEQFKVRNLLNFRIINYDLFLKLIGLDEEYKKRFLEIIEYISKRDIENLKKCSSSNLTLNHRKELRKTFKEVFKGYKTLEEIESRYISDINDYIY